jgi:isopenicillin N synthase-like dioxygenase
MKLPTIDFRDLQAEGAPRDRAVDTIGRALEDIGFFAVEHHPVDAALQAAVYKHLKAFFALPDDVKARYEEPARKAQRGYTSFGREHAKDQPVADLKEFWQVGRTDVPDDHPVHAAWGANLWPAEVAGFQATITRLYESLESVGRSCLRAAGQYLGEPDARFADVVDQGDTVLRLIHYPPVDDDAPEGAVRAAAHEDINILTVLSGATDEGLQLLDRDGNWLDVAAGHDHLVVDSGDMMQNLTNGVFRATTHRVVRPRGEAARRPRYSMPCFLHARADVDLTPLASCVARAGGEARFPATTAGELLEQRLREIGVG